MVELGFIGFNRVNCLNLVFLNVIEKALLA